MKRPALVESCMFAALFASGTLLRLGLQDLPNFAPVAAIALFAGVFFRSALVAAALPLAIMTVSDFYIGGYTVQMMVLVYAMLALPVACRIWLRPLIAFLRRRADRSSASNALLHGAALVVCMLSTSLAASVVFFLVTNFGSWLWFNLYERSFAGLLECYASALPFFRYTLLGDLLFATVLSCGYAGALLFRPAEAPARFVES